MTKATRYKMEKATIFYINEHGNNLKPQGCNNVPFARHTVVFTQNLIAPFKIISPPHQCILNTKTSQSPNSSRVLCRLNVGGECEEMKKFRFERPLDCAATKRVTRQYGLSCPNPARQFPRRQVAHRSRAEARPLYGNDRDPRTWAARAVHPQRRPRPRR